MKQRVIFSLHMEAQREMRPSDWINKKTRMRSCFPFLHFGVDRLPGDVRPHVGVVVAAGGGQLAADVARVRLLAGVNLKRRQKYFDFINSCQTIDFPIINVPSGGRSGSSPWRTVCGSAGTRSSLLPSALPRVAASWTCWRTAARTRCRRRA